MILSALDRDASHEAMETQVDSIAFHCGINADDVRIVSVDDGGDMKVLRHFVAVDHVSKSVVLSLRGTLSISGAIVDIQAMDGMYSYFYSLHVELMFLVAFGNNSGLLWVSSA